MVAEISFISFFSIDDLENIKIDIELFYNNNRIIYVVDTYDILNYTLPFVNYDISSDSNFKYRHNAIFYESVFSNNNRFDFILPDEYKNELSSVINGFNEKIKNFSNIRKNLLDKLFNSINNEESIDIDDIIENIELFTILYIFYVNGNDTFERFKNFIYNELHIDSFKSSNIDDNEIISDVFKNTQSSNLTMEIFDEFFEQNKFLLLTYNNDLERFSYLDNSYRDISVIDRIYHSNIKLKTNNIIIRYLSSVPNKTNQLFRILKKVTNSDLEVFNRNINQLFLYNFLLDRYPSNKNEAINALDTLIKIKSKHDSFINTIDNSNNLTYKVFSSLKDIFNSYKKEYEKSFYFEPFLHFKNKLTIAIDNYNNKKQSDLVKILKSLFNIDDNKLEQISIINNISPLPKIEQTFSLAKKFKNLSKSNEYILVKTGKDIIKNTFHHLPYFLFCNFEDSDTIQSFHRFLNIVSNYSNIIGYKSIDFKNELEIVLSNLSIDKYTLKKHSIDYIIMSFLNIISDSNDGSNEEDVIIDYINKQKNILIKSLISSKIDNDSLNITFRKSEIIKEFDYVLLWLYRRNKHYHKALKLYDNYHHQNTPRFKQGLGLTYHSIAYENLLKNNFDKAHKYLLKSKNILTKALLEYADLSFDSKHKNKLLIKQRIAILNTIIDANNRIIDINGDIDVKLIKESRVFINKIKSLINSDLNDCIDYSDLETINHSETELEYFEAKYDFNNEDFIGAMRKLNYTIERLPNFSSSSFLVGDNFKSINSKINKLRIDIYKKIGIL